MTRTRILVAAAALAGGVVGGIVSPMLAGADIEYSHSETYQPAFEPVRVLDTRTSGFGLTAGVPVIVEIPVVPHIATHDTGESSGSTPVARAVAVNLTVVHPDGDGYLTAWPAGTAQPAVSNVNFAAGEIEANFAIVPVSNGRIELISSVDTHVIVDLFGQYDALVPGLVP